MIWDWNAWCLVTTIALMLCFGIVLALVDLAEDEPVE
jgi:hypothetical protein